MICGKCGVPTGIRTRVSALKGPRPRPLDDGDYRNSTGSGPANEPGRPSSNVRRGNAIPLAILPDRPGPSCSWPVQARSVGPPAGANIDTFATAATKGPSQRD